MFDRTGVSIGKIEDVDEVAHTGAVPRVIVRPQHFKIRPPPQRRFDGDRYCVSFGRMPFPNSSQGICSCSVEIAQDHASNAPIEVEIPEYLLDNQFASAVRVD